MPSSDLIAPDRVEELVAGALPDTDREARVQGLVLELRSSAWPAPEHLRQRVRALPLPQRGLSPKRAAAVLVPACLLAIIAGALVLGGAGAGDDESGGVEHRGAAPLAVDRSVGEEAAREPLLQPVTDDFGAGRARDIDMWIELRLRNADQLADAADEATRVTRELGGFVAASTVRTSGAEGRAELILRVPTTTVDDAAFRLSELGTVTNQRVVTEDLQTEIDGLSRRIETVDRAIRIAKLRLDSGTLDADERLRVEIRLERLRAERLRLERARGRVSAEAAMAEMTLMLHTREATGGAEDESGISGSARTALEFLARAGSIAIFLAIVLSPLVLVGVLIGLARRSRTRRSEAALLDRTRPSAPSPHARN